jgi:general secretion pathway protein H
VGNLSGATHARRRRGERGFTLVEILVVIVVVGIAASLIVANIGGDDRRDLEREAKRLAGALEHAAALAQWQSETLGVSAEGATYRFWRRDADERWIAFTGDDVLNARALPRGIVVAPASYAGAPVAADTILPFRASGRNEPYVLALASEAGQIVLAADPLSRVQFGAVTPLGAAPVLAR